MNVQRISERATVEPGQLVMPFYLVCDVSSSMTADLAELNDGIRRLRRAVSFEPVVDDVAQVGILTFSNFAKVVLPLCQMSAYDVPVLVAERGTNYGAAFRLLAHIITEDTARLKKQGFRVYRPCVFFLSDGEPADRDWYETFLSTLTYNGATGVGMKAHPVFIPFGFRNASEQVLRRLAYPFGRGRWYHSKHHDIEQALREILNVIMYSVIGSAKSVSTGQPKLLPWVPPPGSIIDSGDAEDWI